MAAEFACGVVALFMAVTLAFTIAHNRRKRSDERNPR